MATASNSNNPAPAQLGRYRIVRELARSNDIVYEAMDPTMNRRVALKELNLPPNLGGQQRRERLERFYREAKAAGTLNHPHIVTIYEIGQEKDRHFIAMEFLAGPSLRDYLNVNGPLPIKLALQIGLDLCDALGYAHAQGVVHRDVKPDNVHLVPPGHTAKLTDFGIARVMEEPSLTTTGQVFGTPSYMSPEQLMAKNVDQRTDLFSLGVLLYEIITGKKPFPGENIQAITYAIVNAPIAFPTGASAGITGILRRALAKDPEQRYPNAHAMATDIRMELMFLGSQHQHLAPLPAHPAETAHTQPPPTAPELDAGQEDATVLADASAAQPAAEKSGQARPRPETSSTEKATGLSAPAPAAPETPAHPPRFVPQPSTYYTPVQPVGNSIAAIVASVCAIVALIAVTAGAVLYTVRNTRIANQRSAAIGHYNAGSSALDSNDPQTAVEEYSDAIKLAPNDAADGVMVNNARRYRALAYMTLGDEDASSDPAAAITYYKMALASGERNATVHFKLAQISSDPDEAIREYEKAIADDPNGPTGYQARRSAAALYLKQGDNAMQNHDAAGARNAYNRIIELVPSDPLAQEARQRLSSGGA